MSEFSADRTLVGVDGCKGGWVCVWAEPGSHPSVSVFEHFVDLKEGFGHDALIAVDMPIGLPEVGERGGRIAEREVKTLPNVPKSSIFGIPSRQAVHAERSAFADQGARLAAHRRAVAIARATSATGSAFSIQAFCIFPKIQQINDVLIREPSLADRIFESHPEVAFCTLNAFARVSPKKIRGRLNPDGMEQRKAILSAHGYERTFLDQAVITEGAIRPAVDDFLDAACMMLVALRRSRGEAVPYPSPSGRDERGIPVAIWA